MNNTIRPRINASKEKILEALLTYFYLTNEQLLWLLYGSSSLSFVREQTRELERAGYVLKVLLPRPGQAGSSPSVWTLSRRGMRHLADRFDVPSRARPSDEAQRSYWHLAHTLSLNDVLIAVSRLCQKIPGLTLAGMVHERTFKRRVPTRVDITVANGNGTERKSVAVLPDAWLDVRLGTLQAALAVELDRGTVEQRDWNERIAAYLAWSHGPYQAEPLFGGTESLTAAIVVDAPPYRAHNVLTWIERTLTELRVEHEADLFRVALKPSSQDGVERLFVSPVWFTPFRRADVPARERQLSDYHPNHLGLVPE